MKDTLTSLEDLLFGFTLEEVQEFGSKLDKLFAEHTNEKEQLAATFNDIQAHMDAVSSLDEAYKQGVNDIIANIAQEFEGGLAGSRCVFSAYSS